MFEVFYGARVQFKLPVSTGPKSSATAVGCCAAAFSGFTSLDGTILTIEVDSLAITLMDGWRVDLRPSTMPLYQAPAYKNDMPFPIITRL